MPKTLMDFVAAARDRVNHISAEQLIEMTQTREDLMILDVREESEFAAGHIPKSMLVPRGILEAAADPAYPKRNLELCKAHQRPIVAYCATGGRSTMATDTLNQMGFQEVYNLAGGFENWEAEELPIEK